jgi:hypothetical protein
MIGALQTRRYASVKAQEMKKHQLVQIERRACERVAVHLLWHEQTILISAILPSPTSVKFYLSLSTILRFSNLQ